MAIADLPPVDCTTTLLYQCNHSIFSLLFLLSLTGVSLSEPHIVVTAVAIVAIVVHVVCPHYVTSRSAHVVVACSGLGTSCTPQLGVAWVRIVHFRVWLNEDRDAEQKKALRREQSG